MIVIVGVPAWRSGEAPGPDGRSGRIALAAAGAGARVELVARVGDDPDGDSLLLALSQAGVGHAAVLRDPTRPTPRVGSATDDDDTDAVAREPLDPATTAGAPEGRGPRLDAADLELGLRYIADYRVLVVADALADDALRAVVDATAYSDAQLVVVATEPPPADLLPSSATVLIRPAEDDEAFATLVGRFAARLDVGDALDKAFRSAVAAVGGAAADDAE